MADESRYSRVSTHVRQQVPAFIRDRKQLFVSLLEAYYEYMEVNKPVLQNGRVIQRAKNLRNYIDPDFTLDDFLEHFYNQFLAFIPKNTDVDRRLLLKHVKDFYRARGTEKSFKFLIRLLSSGSKETEFYYPKEDVLRASTSTWYIQKALRLIDITYDGAPITESNLSFFYLFEGLQITGDISGATAIVDRADHFYDNGYLTDELTVSSILGQFEAGELITAEYSDSDGVHVLEGTVNPGVLASVTVRSSGYGYTIGYEPPVENTGLSQGTGAVVMVSDVTSGSVNTINVVMGGSGYRASDFLLFSGGGGSGANSYISSVNDNGLSHPNAYSIDVSTISLEANTLIGNTLFTNLNSSNANTALANAVSTFLYQNTGPAAFVATLSGGSNYVAVPDISAIGNTRIQALGILGTLNVASRGTGYVVGDTLAFNNPLGGAGVGATANVTNVAANGAIMGVAYQTVPGFPKGGLGWDNDHLPYVTITSSGGSGANVYVESTLGFGATFEPVLSSIGGILEIQVISGGSGYNSAPIINLTQSGSGTANAYANINLGLYTYPGRYLDDTGHLSAFNFLQDRDYYQNYSYVVRVDESLEIYRRALMKLVHPAGLALFSEYLLVEDDVEVLTANANASVVTVFDNFTPNTHYFDGNTLFRTANSVYLGTSDLNQGHLSLWIYPERLPDQNEQIAIFAFGSNGNRSKLVLENASSYGATVGLYMQSGSVAGANASVVISDPNTAPMQTNTWVHLLASWSSANTIKNKLYVNSANSMGIRSCLGSGSVEQSASPVIVGAQLISATDTTNFYKGALSQFFLSNSWIDLDVSANRDLYANNLTPRNLIVSVLSNTSIESVMFFNSTAANANVNYNATMNSFNILYNTVTSFSSNPVEVT
jgi:hypothetical protein